MTIFLSGKGVSVTREVFQPTKKMPIKPSLLIITNAKDNEMIIDLIYDHTSLIPCCFAHWLIYPLTKAWPELAAVKIYERNT